MDTSCYSLKVNMHVYLNNVATDPNCKFLKTNSIFKDVLSVWKF